MRKIIDVAGRVFGRLTVICRSNEEGNKWECECSCGNKKTIEKNSLISGRTKSCGCYKIENTIKMSKTHGETSDGAFSSEYNSYRGIIQRCLNENNEYYFNYGGRGITVCDEWINSYETFLKDMGRKPTPKHTIERIDNNKGYYKENCRWATHKEQANNRRSARKITIGTETKCLTEWGLISGWSLAAISKRLKNGWSECESVYGRSK